MHLLIVHQNFVDHEHPGGTRHFELARDLVQRGHQCTIVAGSVDFLTGQPLSRQPTTYEGVTIRRAYALPTIHHSYLGRAASYLCFMLTAIWVGLRVRHVDVVMGTSPPMFQLPSAWLIARLKRCPFILEVRDLWPDFAIDMGVLRSRWLIRFASFVERFFYRHHDWAVINSPGFSDHLKAHGVSPERLTVIPNGVDTGMFDPTADGSDVRKQLGLQDRFVATYAGSLGRANDLTTLIYAAKRLRMNDRLVIVLVGGGKERGELERQVREAGLENVRFAGVFPKSKMSQVLAASDVCIAILQDRKMFRTVYPNKVFDYMAAGRPTILAIDGVIREVIEAADGGCFVPPGDDRALAAAIEAYAQRPDETKRQGRSARAYVEAHFERTQQAALLAEVMERVVRASEHRGWYESCFKRFFDLAFSGTLLILFSPLIVLVALLVRLRLGSPAVFRQTRAGRHGRLFTVYKFRTMRDAYDEQGNPLPDEQRLTPLGQTLRTLSLDELPQLWNILKGEMSLIGPRPLLDRYLPRYSPEQARRHEVRPGITGWAQVNGRNMISWEDRFELDVWYVDHCSLKIDLTILWRTLVNVLMRRDISAAEHATMPEFMGSETEQTMTTSQGASQ